MTKKEALIATLQVAVPDDSVELAMINADIVGGSPYTKADMIEVEKCAIPLLYGLFTAPDVGEGGYSISYPDFLRKIKERLLYLARKNGMTDIVAAIEEKPSVTGKSVW